MPPEVLQAAAVRRGDVLAHAVAEPGADEQVHTWLLGTRDALVLVSSGSSSRVPWERVETADWDREGERLRVVEVGTFGEPQPVHAFTVTDPGDLLAMVRERVTASVLLQRRVVLEGRRGFSVIARRAPQGRGPIIWACEYDAGLDPDDPVVRGAVEAAVRAAQDDVGTAGEPI